MTRTIADLVAERQARTFFGRGRELETLSALLREDGPLVLCLHGIGGVGKSRLLHAFAERARAAGATMLSLDGQAMPPTPDGFLRALAGALRVPSAPATVLARLSAHPHRMVLALDSYETLRPIDEWLRETFLPSLSENVRLLLVGREPPAPAWLAARGWHGLFRGLLVEPLPEGDALDLLGHAGIAGHAAHRINRFARGHPLALTLAAAAITERPDLDVEELTVQRIVEHLALIYLADVTDRPSRRAIQAAAIVRSITRSLLAAMLPDQDADAAYQCLRALPFTQSGPDGLLMHDLIREAVAADLRRSDPAAFRTMRRAAWLRLRAEAASVEPEALWSHTADLLYLLEDPFSREALVPSEGAAYSVEPARPNDAAAIRAIVRAHDGPEAASALDLWWTHAPRAFFVMRQRDGAVSGFYCMAGLPEIMLSALQPDPVVRAWRGHLERRPVETSDRLLFARRYLERAAGEGATPVQALLVREFCRSLSRSDPPLRRFYLACPDLDTYGAFLRRLRFELPAGGPALLDGRLYHAAALDLGPDSVAGWLSDLLAQEPGAASLTLDAEARELIVDGARCSLSPLEFGVIEHLWQRDGKAVTRADLIEQVWGYRDLGGSNVVDAVVRSLRKKLGAHAAAVETVTKIGYRFRSA